MAKFKLRADLVPKLVERKVVSPVTGKIKMRIPWKEYRITGEKCYEFEFLPTDVIETSNEFTIKILTVKASPRIKTNGQWWISDPSIPWFEQVDEATVATVTVENSTEVLRKQERKLVHRYAKDLHLSVPPTLENSVSNRALYQAAAQHHNNKNS